MQAPEQAAVVHSPSAEHTRSLPFTQVSAVRGVQLPTQAPSTQAWFTHVGPFCH
jgi:hypothetical protein